MKHLIFIFSFFFSVSLFSQSVQCYKCSKKTEIKTNSIISGNSFTGLVIKRPNKADVLLHAPIQISNKNKWFRMEDLYGTKIELDISTLGPTLNTINKFYDFVGSCFCTSDEASFNVYNSEVDGVENTLYVDTSDASIYLWNGYEYITKEVLPSVNDGLRLESANVVLGSDSPTDPKGSQLIQDNNLHLNGFNQNWINNPLEPTRPTLSVQDNGDVFFGATNTTAASFRSALFFDHSKSSIAVGYHEITQLDNLGSFAFIANDRTSATGNYSSAFGLSTTASGIGSFATGFSTTASNQNASSFGSSTIASGRRSLSMGEITTASGNNSFAGGISSQSQAVNSFAFGNTSIASGLESISFGKSNTASGPQSAVLGGASNISSGTYSSSLGYGLVSKSYFEHTIGSNNVDYTPTSAVAFSLTDRTFTVANGSSISDKSHALTILKNGRTKIISRLNAAGSLTNAEVTPRTAFEVLTVTENGGNSNGGALLAPQTTSQRNSISGVDLIDGLIIYCTDGVHQNGNNGTYQVYQASSSSWVNLSDGSEVRQQATGVLVDWQSKKIFGSEVSPETGSIITFNFVSQRVEQQWMFHQAAGVPTFPIGSVVSGTYNNGAINFIRFEYVSPTRINILINQ